MSKAISHASLQYLKLHWSIIPIRARDKRPAIKWAEFEQRRADEDEVNEWFKHIPDANVAIVTGNISGLVVLDIDVRQGGDESLAQWERQHGPLPSTLEVISGGGGRHLYFKHPGGTLHNRVGVASGIDFRGDGGCIVAPPSIHSSGKVYQWRKGHEPGNIAMAEMPNWLLNVVSGKSTGGGHSLQYWRQRIRESVPKGERNNTLASLAGHLLWHGVDAEVVQELLLSWNQVRCQPPLKVDEVVKTVNSIMRLHQQKSGH